MGDWISGNPGISNSRDIRAALEQLESLDIILPVWNQARDQGAHAAYKVAGFARVRLLSFDLPSQNRISARFLGFVTCGAVNLPPRVDAGPDQTVLVNQPLTLNGALSHDGLPALGRLAVNWSKVSGPGNAAFSSTNTAMTSVVFDQPGSYVLSLSATDGELTAGAQVNVTVNVPNHPVSIAINGPPAPERRFIREVEKVRGKMLPPFLELWSPAQG